MSDILKIEKGVVTGLNNKDYEGDIIVPEYDNHIRVTQIAAEAFANCERIISVEIPDSITSIGKFAFFNCKRLKTVTLGHGINKIERSAFQNCEALESIELHYGIPEIASWTFSGCKSLKEVVIPNGVKYIGHQAFADCVSLEHIDTLSSETSLGYDVFQNMNSKCVITVPLYFDERYKKLQQWNEFEIKVNEKRIFSYNGLRYHEVEMRKTIAVAKDENRNFVGHADIPSKIEFLDLNLSLTVCGIEDDAFRDNDKLASVHVSKNVVTIGKGAFARCANLEYFTSDNGIDGEVGFEAINGVLFNKEHDTLVAYPAGNDRQIYSIPASVTKIEDYAFSSMRSLLRIGFPNKEYDMHKEFVFDSVGKEVISNCYAYVPKDAVKLKNLLESLGFKVNTETFSFEGLNYKILTDDEEHTVEVTDNRGFVGELVIPERVSFAGVEYVVVGIGGDAFLYNCKTSNITLADTIKYIGKRAFYDEFGKSLLSAKPLTLPKSLESVGEIAFVSPSLTFANLDFPENMKEISGWAFVYNKVNTKKVTISAGVRSLGFGMFRGTIERIEVDKKNENYKSLDGVLFSKDGESLIEYPPMKSNTEYEVQEGVKNIEYQSFCECQNLKRITLPSTVNRIGSQVFYGSVLLQRVVVNAVTPPKVDSNAFQNFNSNCFVLVPKGCANKYKAADGWKQIANQIIDEIPSEFTVNNIKYKVLSLEDRTVEVAKNPNASGAITIPSNVPYLGFQFTVVGVGAEAFYHSKITSISLPNTIKSVGYDAFNELRISMSLPSSLEKVESRAFRKNIFEDLSLPSGLKEIGSAAFAFAVVKSKRATIPSSVIAIVGNVFYDSVKEIKVSDSNPAYKSINGVLLSKDGRKLTAYPCMKPDTVYSIPSGVTTIENDQCATYLTRLVIPASVNQMVSYALWSFTNLKTLEVQCTTPPAVGKDSIHGIPSNCLILVPKGCVSKYKAAEGWKEYADRIVDEIIPEIRYISLKNNGGFVVSIRVKGGSESYNGSSFPIGQERTEDLANAVGKIKDGDEVWLETVVKGGKNNVAKQHFVYRKSSNKKACYSIKGTTLNNSLSFNGISS